MGLWERILTLPVMLDFVLRLIRHPIGSVTEVVCCREREGLLWPVPLLLSQQAVEQRLRSLPAVLFGRVLQHGAAPPHTWAAAWWVNLPPTLAWA